MSEIGAYDAKTHLPRLLDSVEKGERFVITRHGRPVAELVPYVGRDAERVRSTIAAMRAFRGTLAKRGVRLSDMLKRGETLRELMHDDHRY
jgi:prevent-host-death family protein